MADLFTHKFATNGLAWSSGFFFCTALTCTSMLNNHQAVSTGAIYGRLQIKSSGKYLSPQLATVYVEGTDLIAKPDSDGIFYFPEIIPGKHTLIGRAQEFPDYVVEGVEVREDSISFVAMFSLSKQFFPERRVDWDGAKIKRVDIRRRGSMAGRVISTNKDQAIAKTGVSIKGTVWAAGTDSLGRFRIDDILPGIYSAISMADWHHHTTIYGIRVAPDSTSIVDFRLRHRGIPESPAPLEWEPKFIKE